MRALEYVSDHWKPGYEDTDKCERCLQAGAVEVQTQNYVDRPLLFVGCLDSYSVPPKLDVKLDRDLSHFTEFYSISLMSKGSIINISFEI